MKVADGAGQQRDKKVKETVVLVKSKMLKKRFKKLCLKEKKND